MAIDLKARNVNPDDTSNKELIAALLDTQGNILKSHGRDHSRHLFLRFDNIPGSADDRTAVQRWLATMSRTRITSAWRQWENSKDRARRIAEAKKIPDKAERDAAIRKARTRSTVFINLFLTADGYRRLGIVGQRELPSDPSFLAGSKDPKIRRILNDPDPKDWDQGFNQELDALVIVAADSTTQVDTAAQEIVDTLPATIRLVHQETGSAMRVDDQSKFQWDAPVREPFGFLDGISNPQFFAKDVERAAARMAELGGSPKYDPSAELGLALLKDPGGGAHGYGSYFIYRKLEQDVPGFKHAQQRLAERLAAEAGENKPAKDYLALAGAYIMGRFQDGTPLVTHGSPGKDKNNDFDYADDLSGNKCPFPSHARKMNPRGETTGWGEQLAKERSRRIVRRGISYGPVTLEPAEHEKVGMLFLAAQSSIKGQFEFIQGSWGNADNFPEARVGIDPIAGQIPSGGKVRGQKWPRKYGNQHESGKKYFDDISIGPLVTMRGAAYFFAPSLSFLRFGEPA